jgi:hypothetical protein
MTDADTKRDVDLKTDWDVCFFPGQRIELSMVFKQQENAGNQYPKCQEMSISSTDLDVELYVLVFLNFD